jgi:hypothetical protein
MLAFKPISSSTKKGKKDSKRQGQQLRENNVRLTLTWDDYLHSFPYVHISPIGGNSTATYTTALVRDASFTKGRNTRELGYFCQHKRIVCRSPRTYGLSMVIHDP